MKVGDSMKSIFLILIFCVACGQAPVTKKASDREHDGFVGPVKKVFVEWSPISGGSVPAGSRCRDMTKVYDSSGRLMQHSVYSGACGDDERREDYTYTQDGSRTAKTLKIQGKDSPPPPPPAKVRSSSEEEGQPRTVFKYAPSGKLIEDASVKPGGKVFDKYTYSYDDKGRMTESTGYEENGQISVRRVYSYTGHEQVPSGFTYIGRGGKVYERTTYADYEFNSRGDWVKRKETIEETLNRKNVLMVFRDIEYYPDGK